MRSVSAKMRNGKWGKSATSNTSERERRALRYILQHSLVFPFENQLNYAGEEKRGETNKTLVEYSVIKQKNRSE